MFIYKPQELYKVEKGSDETLFVSIDLKEILDTTEIAISIPNYTSTLPLDRLRTRRGKTVECRILPLVFDTTAAFVDYKINIQVETNLGSIRSINFICRVHR